MIKADKPMKRIFFSEVATLLLHRWENWLYQFYHIHMRLEVHPCYSPQALQVHLGRERGKKLGWHHSTQDRLALNSSLIYTAHCFPLILGLWHERRLRECQCTQLFPVQRLLHRCSSMPLLSVLAARFSFNGRIRTANIPKTQAHHGFTQWLSSFPLPFQILTSCFIYIWPEPMFSYNYLLRTLILVLFKLSS